MLCCSWVLLLSCVVVFCSQLHLLTKSFFLFCVLQVLDVGQSCRYLGHNGYSLLVHNCLYEHLRNLSERIRCCSFTLRTAGVLAHHPDYASAHSVAGFRFQIVRNLSCRYYTRFADLVVCFCVLFVCFLLFVCVRPQCAMDVARPKIFCAIQGRSTGCRACSLCTAGINTFSTHLYAAVVCEGEIYDLCCVVLC